VLGSRENTYKSDTMSPARRSVTAD
jgi:hypothetical protein